MLLEKSVLIWGTAAEGFLQRIKPAISELLCG